MTLDTTFAIPPLPAARAHTLSLLLQPHVSLAEVAAVAEADPALTVTLLRAANSAASSPLDQVRRTADALVRLGVDDSRGLILGTPRRARWSDRKSTSSRCGGTRSPSPC